MDHNIEIGSLNVIRNCLKADFIAKVYHQPFWWNGLARRRASTRVDDQWALRHLFNSCDFEPSVSVSLTGLPRPWGILLVFYLRKVKLVEDAIPSGFWHIKA